MIELKTQTSANLLAELLVEFFKSHSLTPTYFFQNANVYLPPYVKLEEGENIASLKKLILEYCNSSGFWYLFHDKWLGKIHLVNPFIIYKDKEYIPAKILSTHELILGDEFGLLNQRKIQVLALVYPKKYKNQLKYTSENVYVYWYFDELTGLKLWDYSSSIYYKETQTFYYDLKNYFQNYHDEALKLRSQFISVKSPIKEFPLERIIKYLIHPIHFSQKNQHKEMIQKLNAILSLENIQIVFDENQQIIHFYNSSIQKLNEKNQTYAIDNVSSQIQDFQQKVQILFRDDDLLPLLESRLKELEVVYRNQCYLSTIVIIGSFLEALLKKTLFEMDDNYYKLNKLPRDAKDNTIFKPVKALNFKEMVDIYQNNSIISKNISYLIDSYRDFRNQIHVYHEDSKNSMNHDICEIGFRVLKMLINELYEKRKIYSI